MDDFLFAYLSAPIFVALYLGHKIWTVSHGSTWKLHRPRDIDLDTGRDEVEQDEGTYPPLPTTKVAKFLHWLWGA